MEEIAIEPQMGLNFNQVWALFKETTQQLKDSSADFDRRMQETDRRMQESRADFDRRMQETAQEIRELSKNIGGLNNSLGKLIEQMFSVQLWEKFDLFGYTFTQGGNRKFIENKQIIAEVDIFLENGEYVMPVEVKTQLKLEDVDEHIKRIERIRGYMDRRRDKRWLVGAVAGGVVPDAVRRYAQSLGLYVLEQSGESVIIVKSPDGFMARRW